MENSMENMHTDVRLQWVKPWDVVWIFKMNATYAAHSKDKSCDQQFFCLFKCMCEMKASIPFLLKTVIYKVSGRPFS